MLLTVAKRSAQEVAALSPGKLPPPPRVVVDTAA